MEMLRIIERGKAVWYVWVLDDWYSFEILSFGCSLPIMCVYALPLILIFLVLLCWVLQVDG